MVGTLIGFLILLFIVFFINIQIKEEKEKIMRRKLVSLISWEKNCLPDSFCCITRFELDQTLFSGSYWELVIESNQSEDK